MALFNPTSFLPQIKPQVNQYLTGDPLVKESAQTDWMDPAKANAGLSTTPKNIAVGEHDPTVTMPAQPATGVSPTNTQPGTALGAITAGSPVGTYMPGGYGQTKWDDPNKHDPKYDLGRILSQYQPGSDGFRQAQDELMRTGMIGSFGKDGFTLNDKSGYGGHYIDVGNSFGDPNANHSWQWLDKFNDGRPGNSPASSNSFMSFLQSLFGNAGGPYSGNNTQWVRPTAGNSPYNPMGQVGTPNPDWRWRGNPNTGVAGGIDRSQGLGIGPSSGYSSLQGMGMNPDPSIMSYLSSGLIDPLTGLPRQPSGSEA